MIELIHLLDINLTPIDLTSLYEKSFHKGLVESIRVHGVVTPIILNRNKSRFDIIDGLRRVHAANTLALKSVPAVVYTLSPEAVQESLLIKSVHHIETKPVEYAKQLKKLLAMNPTATLTSMAKQLKKSVRWLENSLSLNNLHPTLQAKLDKGELNLTNAYRLAKLTHEEQLDEFK